MAKIRTLGQLQDLLDQSLGWRLKDVSNLKIAAKSGGISRKTFIRAGIPLVYAHWEGFIKEASIAYLNFVDNQGHTYTELKSYFALFGLKGKLDTLGDSKKTRANLEALEFIISRLGDKSQLQLAHAVNTEANLTSRVFGNIAASLDLSTDAYETKYNLIDESLVDRRNRVAHGEFLDLEVPDFLDLSEEVLNMMRSYKNDVLNAAASEQYKRLVTA